MQSVSDDDVRKRLLEKSRFQLAAKSVFSDWEDVRPISSGRAFQVFGPATGKARLPTVDHRLTDVPLARHLHKLIIGFIAVYLCRCNNIGLQVYGQ